MRFSIITVTRNNWSGLARTGESLRAQQRELYEWIIIDGASTDGTQERIGEFGGLVDHFSSELDEGIYDAMNKGLRLARGDFVLFLNGDDILLPNVLECVEAALSDSLDGPFSMLFGPVIFRLPDGSARHRGVLNPADHLWHRMPSSHQAILFDRLLHLNVPHDLSYPVSSDYYTIAKIYRDNDRPCLTLEFEVSETLFGGASFSANHPMQLLKDHHRIQTEVLEVPFVKKWASLARKAAVMLYIQVRWIFA